MTDVPGGERRASIRERRGNPSHNSRHRHHLRCGGGAAGAAWLAMHVVIMSDDMVPPIIVGLAACSIGIAAIGPADIGLSDIGPADIGLSGIGLSGIGRSGIGAVAIGMAAIGRAPGSPAAFIAIIRQVAGVALAGFAAPGAGGTGTGAAGFGGAIACAGGRPVCAAAVAASITIARHVMLERLVIAISLRAARPICPQRRARGRPGY